MKKFFRNNIKVIVAFIVGLIVSGTTVYEATSLYYSDTVGFDNSNAKLKKVGTNKEVDNVQDAIDAIYNKVINSSGSGEEKCTTSPFRLGDYIDFTPSLTTFSTNTTYTNYATSQTLHPNYLNVWRVLRINSDCTVEVVSDYVSDASVGFKGKVGYINYVYYLNEIAKAYANTTFTLNPITAPKGAFRNVGYDRQTEIIDQEATLPAGYTEHPLNDSTLGSLSGLWYKKSTSINEEESLGGGDQGYSTDFKLMADAGISYVAFQKTSTAIPAIANVTATSYWLASRIFYWDGKTRWFFSARVAGNYGVVGNTDLYNFTTSSFGTSTGMYAVRPIVTLKSGLSIASGSGTSSSHYTLSAN